MFAQAGDGNFQSRLIAELKQNQAALALAMPDATDAERFLAGYGQLWPTYWQEASNAFSKLKSGDAHIRGTILAAVAADASGPARIHAVDFATGEHSASASIIQADGTDPAAFTAVATGLLQTLRQPGKPFAIDAWGLQCIDACVQSHPEQVGWPADLAIARASDANASLLVRVDDASVAGGNGFII